MDSCKLFTLGNPISSIENYNQACIPLLKNIAVNWFVLDSLFKKGDKGENVHIDVDQITHLKTEANTVAQLVNQIAVSAQAVQLAYKVRVLNNMKTKTS